MLLFSFLDAALLKCEDRIDTEGKVVEEELEAAVDDLRKAKEEFHGLG